MSTFGCHNCKADLKAFEDKPYEEWPCAKCALAKEYSHSFNTGYFETPDEEALYDDNQYTAEDAPYVIDDQISLDDHEISTLRTIKEAITHQILSSLSGAILKLLKLASSNKLAFEVLVKKMQFPYMSYSDIGVSLDPPCSKQNVLYHLKNAVKAFPELESVLVIDSRYSGGRYALKTLSQKLKEQQATTRIRQNLYGDEAADMQARKIEELNAILHLPFMIDRKVLDFNAYADEEESLSDDRTEQKE